MAVCVGGGSHAFLVVRAAHLRAIGHVLRDGGKERRVVRKPELVAAARKHTARAAWQLQLENTPDFLLFIIHTMEHNKKPKIVKPLTDTRTLSEKVAKRQADAQEVKGDSDAFTIYSEEPPKKKKKQYVRTHEQKLMPTNPNAGQEQEPAHAGKSLLEAIGGDFSATAVQVPVEDETDAVEAGNEEALPTLPDLLDEIEREAAQAREEPTLDAVMHENERRMAMLTLQGIDQITGEGLPAHTERVEIPDYPIQVQWLTKEVTLQPMYQKVVTLGSISAYVEWFNLVHREELEGSVISSEDVMRQLFLLRLQRDPAFAFAKCFCILNKQNGLNTPFILNYAQIILLERLESMRRRGKPIRLVLLKARQWGGSTLVQLYMAWIQIFILEGWNSVIIAQTKDTARRIKGMYSRTLKHFPSDVVFNVSKLRFSPKEGSASDSTITDENGKVVRDNAVTIASFENFEATRGSNFAMAHFSEVAYWTNTPGKTAESVITNIAGGMLIAPLTLEVMESTANGMSGFFYDEYQLAADSRKKSSREALFIPFFYIPHDTKPFSSVNEKMHFARELMLNRYDETETPTSESGHYLWSLWQKGASLESINWYITKRASFHDHASMASEAPSDDVECFKHSGHTVFDQYLVDRYRKEFAREPSYTGDIMQGDDKVPRLLPPDPKGLLWIWQRPDNAPTCDRYIVVVDVGGRSTKADFSVITVVDRWPLRFGGKAEVVARWRGHIRYDFLAYKAVMIATFYMKALLVFESNTYDKKKAESSEFIEQGDHTRGILETIESTYRNLYMRASTSPEDIRNGRYKKIGFQTNVKTKQEMVDHFMVSFEDNVRFLDPDYRAYEEMAIYEQRADGSYGNIEGRDNHDDILMTDMIADLISSRMPMPSTSKPAVQEETDFTTINESYV